jgi:type I restriction enzyme R subunit
MVHTETAFESVAEATLLANGYVSLPKIAYDIQHGIFPDVVLTFIQQTQPKEWNRLDALLGYQTGSQVLADLTKWMDTNGSIATLRHGFKCYGRTLRVAYFRAAHGLNPELEERYAANRVAVTRQLRYSERNANELDLVISVNGIPVATIELKNPMTGQSAADAIHQYQHDRDPRELLFEFKRRTLVHFAVDPEVVFMATKLAGPATHFLPFNKGREDGSAGNPPDPAGRAYRTAYLWEEALQRDSLLDLLARFIHIQTDEVRTDTGQKVKKETLIFPRYHQLQAVRLLEEAARTESIGHNYLIEHSAGSGKSNTIGWLTHRLASLHDANNARVFDTVIVVTDRRVLDRQLQDTVYQFEHRQGVVQKIDDDSKQLAIALESGVPIVITTVQKFPFVGDQLIKLAEERGEVGTGRLPARRFAVVVDEAHSSQSGESATELKSVLGGDTLHRKAIEQALADGEDALAEVYHRMAKRGRQENVSFFAFTATPKHKTKVIFGRSGEASHKYTMRQAIEEEFILDVLKNYVTYAVYYRLLQRAQDDPEVERKKAAKALARFMKLHPYNIAQKTEVMIEHFNAVTLHKIGGRAKAMVVTDSRLSAVRYKQSFDRYLKDKGYSHIKTLVAFSGQVVDDKIPDKTYTEVAMNNGIKEGALPEAFATVEYQVLLVAEKYQTGFDQPLLHTMYVDKRLAGIQAVQTLSRLNRTHPLKEDTFVLDFVNDRDEIRDAFKQYYDGSEMGEQAEPSRLYELKSELEHDGIFLREEVDRFCAVYFQPKEKQSPADHQRLNAALDPAVDRFRVWRQADEAAAEGWRGTLNAFKNLYAFLSQIIPYQDSDLERLYTFVRYLSPKLPRHANGPAYTFDDDIRLKYYRIQKIKEGSIDLSEGEATPLDGPSETGTGLVREERVRLSKLITIVNERFGTDFTEADQLFFDQIVEDATADEALGQVANANPVDKFALLFGGHIESLMVDRMDQNQEIFARYMSDPTFQKVVNDWLAKEVYSKLQKPGLINEDATYNPPAKPRQAPS